MFFHHLCAINEVVKEKNDLKIIKFEQLDNLGDPLGINIEEQTSETFKWVTIQPFVAKANKTYRVKATVKLVAD